MTIILLIVVSSFCCFAARAQQNDILNNKTWQDFKNKKLSEKLKWSPPAISSPQSLLPAQPQQNKMVLMIPLKNVYVGKNEKGDDIFSMQPDNMPCLVPNKSLAANMPVLGKADKLPDLIPAEPITGDK